MYRIVQKFTEIHRNSQKFTEIHRNSQKSTEKNSNVLIGAVRPGNNGPGYDVGTQEGRDAKNLRGQAMVKTKK